jgi:hypothetical protein
VSERPSSGPNGLCDSCLHQQLVPNTRGSVFSLCRRSKTDARYPRYPRVPVGVCPGYEAIGSGSPSSEMDGAS